MLEKASNSRRREMKKVLFLAALLSMGASMAQAEGKWRLQLGLGPSILASNFNPIYSVGLGLGAGVGYAVNENWSFWLTSNGYYLPADTPGLTAIMNEAILNARYTFQGSGVNPYAEAGFGLLTQTISSGGYSLSSSDLMLQGGLGLTFPGGDGLDFFIEAEGGLILFDGVTAVDIPITAGVIIDL
jgi:hypothetical protein